MSTPGTRDPDNDIKPPWLGKRGSKLIKAVREATTRRKRSGTAASTTQPRYRR